MLLSSIVCRKVEVSVGSFTYWADYWNKHAGLFLLILLSPFTNGKVFVADCVMNAVWNTVSCIGVTSVTCDKQVANIGASIPEQHWMQLFPARETAIQIFV